MIKVLIYFLSIIVLLALNVVFPKFYYGVPNFLLLLVVVYAFRKDNPDYLWIAFGAGFFLDLYSNSFFGTYTISFILISVIINYTTRSFFSADPSIVYFAIVTAVSNLMLVGMLFLFSSIGMRFQPGLSEVSGVYLNQKIWIDLFFNIVFVAPVYYLSSVNERIIEHYSRQNQGLI